MHLSLTCACGARLEIDEKFRGQTITCPDCQKPLSTAPPPRVQKKTSACALASLLLALIGAFTLVGPLLAIVCGFWGLRTIGRSGERLEGRRLAQAGIGLGLFFGALTVAAFFWADWIGLDGVLRGLEWADKLDYTGDIKILQEQTQGRGFSLDRPDLHWGRFTGTTTTGAQQGDLLVLVHVRDDAYIIIQEGMAELKDDADECSFKAQDRIRESPFLRKLGRLRADAKFPELKSGSQKQFPNTDILELRLETKLAGIPRSMITRVHRVGTQLFVVTCLSRKHRFDRLETTFQKVLDSFAVEQ